jgi:hypothetical protein
MKYHIFLNEMLERKFIDMVSLPNFQRAELKSNIEDLTNRLDSEIGANKDKIINVLKLMSEISIYKEALNMKTHANILPDKNAPERMYLQVRGAVPFEKGDRVWVGHYMGRIEGNDKKIRINSYTKDEGRYEVIKKVVEKLKIKNGL